MKTLIAVSVLSILSFGAHAERQSNEPIKVIEPISGLDSKKIELGKTLWFEPRLSASNTISCNSCHNIAKGGVDNLPSSIGHKWSIGPINSPTVFNSDLNFVQFWNGRAKDLQEQAAGLSKTHWKWHLPTNSRSTLFNLSLNTASGFNKLMAATISPLIT